MSFSGGTISKSGVTWILYFGAEGYVLWCNQLRNVLSEAAQRSHRPSAGLRRGPVRPPKRAASFPLHERDALSPALASVEFSGDLLVEFAGNDPREDLALAC